ncbi:putative MFS nicotinic acid transporter Tna1 [Hysterangium stoloniferum]|nr:putative MFS nicotinic acid transporter Tna1 [Hysterangium stoloniferum]
MVRANMRKVVGSGGREFRLANIRLGLIRMEAAEKSSQHDARPLQGCDEGSLHGQEAQYNLELKMSPAEEKRLLRRIDLWIVPYSSFWNGLMVHSLISCDWTGFLDRVNIGQARLAGLEKDLNLHGSQKSSVRPIIQYDIALTIFFISYAASMGLVNNAKGLYATRWLLGMFEAGLFPGLNLLFSTWYTRNELNVRVSIFFAGATLAGEKIVFMVPSSNLPNHASFILEGLVTLICALPAPWLIQDFPQYSNLLTPTEKAKWLHRLNVSQGVTNAPLPFTTKQVWRALTDWKTYIYSLMYLFSALGFTNAAASALSAAPYALGTIVTITMGAISDRLSMRSPIIGYTILLCDVSPAVKFMAVFITVVGANSSIPTAITFVPLRQSTMNITHREIISVQCTLARQLWVLFLLLALIMTIFFSNIGGIIASNVYPIGDAPKYIRGHAIALGFSSFVYCLAIVTSAFMGFYNMQENARKDRIYGVPDLDGSDCSPVHADDPVRMKKWGLEGMSKREIIELGDKHPAFRYMI